MDREESKTARQYTIIHDTEDEEDSKRDINVVDEPDEMDY